MANDISIDADFVINEQPDIQADLHINFSPDVSNLVTREELAEDLAEKQDVLTAGDNIQIEDNVISATDTTYTAGEGISIVNNVISNTQTSTEWGNVKGDIANQTDLIDLIDTKIDIEATARENNDLALQNGINTLNDDLTAEISNRGTADGILQDNIDTLSGTVTSNYNTLDGLITNEATARSNADDVLNGKIGDNKTAIDNHIADKTNPHDVTKSQVGLGNVDNTSDLNKPISTATQNALNTKVSNTREINGYSLSSDINLTASDVDALPDSTVIGNGTLTIQKNGSTIDSFGANDTGNTTVNISVPTDTGDLTNNAGFITGINSTDVTNALGYTPYNSTNPDGYQENIIETIKVNNTAQTVTNKTVNITVPITASDVNALPDTTKYAASMNLSIDGSTYVISAQLKDQNGDNLGQAQTIDLPLESVVVSGSYDSTNKKVILTLKDGSTIEFSVADLVSGLQTEITASNKLDADLVDDSTSTNKFATASQLAQIGTNQTNIGTINTTIGGYGDIVTHDTDEFATSSQGALADTAVQPADLATVATTGDYDDLTNKPTIPDAQIQSDWNQTITTAKDYIKNKPTIPDAQVQSDWSITSSSSKAYIKNKPNLANVATSGSYNDLTNKPTIPAAQVQSNWNETDNTSKAYIKNKPTIPTVGNGTITVTQGGVTKGTFTTNQSSNSTIALDAVGSDTDVQINGTSITSGGVANIVTNTAYNASSNKIATMSDLPTIDSALSSTSTNPVQNKVINSALSDKYDASNPDGYITGITSTDISNALGYTPPNYFTGSNILINPVEKVTLPSGYTQVSYIEGTGSQYIDTGWNFSNTYPVKIDCKFIVNSYSGGSGGYPTVYGLQTSAFTNWIYPFYINAGNFNAYIGGLAGLDSIPCTLGQIYNTSFTINNGTWSRTINGSSSSGNWSGTITTAANMFLFGGSYGANPINQLIGKIFSFKITVNNSVVRNYIPCKRNSDNVAGMYDLVTSTFKPSASGSFLMGEEVTASGDMISAIVPTNNNQLVNGAGYITNSAIANMQTTTNLVTSVSSSSTDSQYPSAKLFYDTVGDIETALNTINSGV